MSANTSVIVPCYNVADKVGLQLQALAQQEDHEPFEVILVNNKSTDDLASAVAPFQSKLNVRIVDALEHAGVSYARNVGIAASAGEYLIFCDGDDVVSPHFVANGQKTLKKHHIYAAGFEPVDTSRFISVESALEGIFETAFEDPRSDKQDPEWPILPGGSFGIRRQAMFEIGGFDLCLEPGAEDNDFGLRAADLGYFPAIINSATIAYRTYPVGQRKTRSSYKSAKSVALLLHFSKKWDKNPITRGKHPFILFAKTIGAGAKTLLLDRASLPDWKNRFAQSCGIFFGWLQYEKMRKIPQRKIGDGLR